MVPTFKLHAGYASRKMRFVLAKDGNGWKFMAECAGYLVPALNGEGKPLCGGHFDTKADAARMATNLLLPPYAVWNGRKRRYDGKGAVFMVHARTETPSSEIRIGEVA